MDRESCSEGDALLLRSGCRPGSLALGDLLKAPSLLVIITKGEPTLILQGELSLGGSCELAGDFGQQLVECEVQAGLLTAQLAEMVLDTGVEPAEQHRRGTAEGTEKLVGDGGVHVAEGGELDLLKDSE